MSSLRGVAILVALSACAVLAACGGPGAEEARERTDVLLYRAGSESSYSYVEQGAGSTVHGVVDRGRFAEVREVGPTGRMLVYSDGKALYTARLGSGAGEDPAQALRLLERGEAAHCGRGPASEDMASPWSLSLRDALESLISPLEFRSAQGDGIRFEGQGGESVEVRLSGGRPVRVHMTPAEEGEPDLEVEISYDADFPQPDRRKLDRLCVRVPGR